MFVQEKMSRNVITINVSDSLEKAEQIMEQHDFSHIPVIGGQKLIGVLSRSDVESAKEHKGKPSDLSVQEALPYNQHVITCRPIDTIEQAAMMLQNNKVGSLPVVDGSKMIGIITLSDILHTFIDLLWSEGSRIYIELGPEPGLIAKVTEIISSFSISILRIAMFPKKDCFEAVISLDTSNPRPVIEMLQGKGYKIVQS